MTIVNFIGNLNDFLCAYLTKLKIYGATKPQVLY